MSTKIISILATDINNAIGKDNELLIRNPEDMQFFKNTTMGSTVIMGRKTFESLPKGFLPGRHNIVLSNTKRNIDNVEVMNMEELKTRINNNFFLTDKVFVIGGAEIYQYFFLYFDIDEVYHTKIETCFADANKFVKPYWLWSYKNSEEILSPRKIKNSDIEFSITRYFDKRKMYIICYDEDGINKKYMKGIRFNKEAANEEIGRIKYDFPERTNIKMIEQ